MKRRRSQVGFTMIELLMAMAVFSFMLMIVSFGFIQVVRIHQSGIASRATQQNARLVLDSVMKEARASAAVGSGNSGTVWWLCLNRGSQSRMLAVDTNISAVNGGILRVGTITTPPLGACPAPSTVMPTWQTASTWQTLNDTTVAVSQFNVVTTQAVQPGLGSVMVTLTMVSRNNLTALDATRTRCQPGAGSQFCAVTTLSSAASLRGGDGL